MCKCHALFSVAVYAEPRGDMLCLLQGQTGGVTHLAFSQDGHRLYSGARKVSFFNSLLKTIILCFLQDAEILCWDLRNPGNVLFTMQRSVLTNQRMYFDQDL
jgi:hypothetical protein